MSSSTSKLAVLHRLSQEGAPVSLKTLIHSLGEEFSERSVRRWLSEMIEEGIVEKLGKKRGTLYQVAGRVNRDHFHPNGCFSKESAQVIEIVRRPIYERAPTAYVNSFLDAYLPNSTFYLPENVRRQLHGAGKRLKYEGPAGTYAHQIFNRLLIDLSYNSSRLEGNTYSLLDTQKLLIEGESAEGKLDEEKLMILNHKEAIRYLVDNASKLKVAEETVCTLHYLLSDGLVEPANSGKLRDHGVRIGGSTYIPFEDKKRLDVQLSYTVDKGELIEDPYEKSFFLLAHLSYLQGFSDVNKRTARLSANIPFIKSNLVPLSFNDVEREDYISAIIAIYELQNIKPLLDLYIFSYLRTCAMYDSTVKAVGFDEVRVRYRQERRALIREIILEGLTGDKMKEYISTQPLEKIPKKDRVSFIEDVLEDLQEMDLPRIAGLGITPTQLEAWLAKRT